MLPARLAGPLGLTQKILLLVPGDQDFVVQRLRGGKALWLGPVSQPGMLDQVARHRARGAECVLRMPSAQGLRRQAPIAVSALSRGYDAVAGEIERQTPFAPDQVYVGYRVEDTVDARGRAMAHLALVPCANADRMLKSLAAAGIIPDRICLADESDANLIGDTVRIVTRIGGNQPPIVLLAVVAGLVLIALISPIWHNASALSKLQNKLAVARQEALSRVGQNMAMDDPQSQMAWLAALRNQRPPSVALLDAISIALPDTAHLAQLELAGANLSIQGVAATASGLIGPLEALPMVKKVEFSAPTLRDPVTGLEQFQLTIQLSAKPAPEVAE